MATVYRGWDPRFDREVAVKVLSHRLTDDPSFRTRFEREARAIAALEHHAIVPVYDYGEEGENLYLVMRLLSGGSLADRVERGPMWLDAIAPVVERVADALDYAHGRGVIHRDVKPANIMFDAGGNAFLADFGIARLAEQTSTLTGLGVVGSPTYMSPEQAEGKTITGASDIYSLGATTYEALAGRPPFSAENPLAVLMQHIRDEPPSLTMLRPDLPEPAVDAVGRAMAKDPGARPETAKAFAAALRETTVRREPSGGATVVEAGRVASPPRPGPNTAPMPPPAVADRMPPPPVLRVPDAGLIPETVAGKALERPEATRVAGAHIAMPGSVPVGDRGATDWRFVGVVAAGALMVIVGFFAVPAWGATVPVWPSRDYDLTKELGMRPAFALLEYVWFLAPALAAGAAAASLLGRHRPLRLPRTRTMLIVRWSAVAVLGANMVGLTAGLLAFSQWQTEVFFAPIVGFSNDVPAFPVMTVGAAVIFGASFLPERNRSSQPPTAG